MRRPGLIALLGLAALGCSSEPPSGETTAPVVALSDAPAPSAAAELALGYVPGDEPTERLIAAAQQAVREEGESAGAHAQLALTLMRRRRESGNPIYMLYAEDAVRAARSLDADDPQVLALHVMILQDQHRFEAARDGARRLVRVASEDPTGHILLGDALLELGDYDGAVAAYQGALDRRPDLRSYNRGAHLRWLHGDVDGAIELQELALDAGSARDPEAMAWCFVDLGAVYWHAGDPRRAEAAADRALALVPRYPPALSLKARAEVALGRPAEAVAMLEAVVARQPSVEDLLYLAERLEELGRPDAARERTAEAEALVAHDPRPMAHHLARRGEDPERALALAERAVGERATVEALATHALALARAGHADAARDAIARAQRLGTPDARLHLIASLVRITGGDRAGATEALLAARALSPNADPRLQAELERELGLETPEGSR